MEKLLKRGNSKIGKNTLCWSIAPVVSCLNCEQCKKHCYALFPYRFYPQTKKAWDNNFFLAKSGLFQKYIISQLEKTKVCEAVRIHVAGDFFSVEYIRQWHEIIKKFPAIQFYGYSKVFDILPVDDLNALENCNIINSIAPDGGLNFGNKERVEYLQKQGFILCPATAGKQVNCGTTCKICLTKKQVCFNLHR